MSACVHPASALSADKYSGQTHCTLCGDVVCDPQLELDPIFTRGARTGAPAHNASSGLRALGGSLRPMHTTVNLAAPRGRPSIEAARRGMFAIARTLEISDDIVEMALGVYKLALGLNAIAGARSVMLCACLYAVCRRERTSHILYDFADINDDNPHAILSYMKLICRATHTDVPPLDPSCLIQRLAEQMDLGDRLVDVVVCALKILRAMKDDWISCGRRPLGVCAAALLASCYVFGIQRSPEQVCGMARLTAQTITTRLTEFSATPAASLESIDAYQATHQTLPPAFGESSRKSTEEDMNAAMRELSSLYYDLVAEAKVSQPPTSERCAKWRLFMQRHSALQNLELGEESLDLTRFTPQEQLHILGLPHTRPIAPELVEQSVKREEGKFLLKHEDSLSESGVYLPFPKLEDDGLVGGGSLGGGDHTASTHAPAPFLHVNDQEQLQQLMQQYQELLVGNDEVRGLREDFDFADLQGNPDVGSPDDLPAPTENYETTQLTAQTRSSPFPATGPSTTDDAAPDLPRELLRQVLYDDERRHALPWEICVLIHADEEDCTDLLSYLILDNEERLLRQKVGEALYKEKWARGQARSLDEIERLEKSRLTRKRRQRQVIQEAVTVPDALERALRGRGAATISVSNIEELIPGFLAEEDATNDPWDTDD